MVGCSDVKRSKYASVGSQKTNPVHILFGDRIRNIDRKLESKKALFLNHVHVFKCNATCRAARFLIAYIYITMYGTYFHL